MKKGSKAVVRTSDPDFQQIFDSIDGDEPPKADIDASDFTGI
jgi:hypothetical protein